MVDPNILLAGTSSSGWDMVESQEIIVPLVNTHDNDADFFTKPLSPKRFKYLRRRVMNLSDA